MSARILYILSLVNFNVFIRCYIMNSNSSNKYMYLSVIIPAYNEEKRIRETIKSIDSYLSRQNYDYEIIVVSDGSKDRTARLIMSLEGEVRGLRLVDNKENHGKGYVVQ